MKISLLLVSSLLLFAKCQKDDLTAINPGQLDKEFEIALNESVTIKGSEANELGTIAFTNLDESRCPANAMCIRQGAAVTTFKITANAFKEAQTVRMFVGDFMPDDSRNVKNRTADTVAVQLANKAKYILILKQVMPYPGTSEDKPKATLTVKLQ